MTQDTLQFRLAYVIRRRREKAGTSQEAFADELDFHRAFYGRIERGHNLTLQTLEHVARGLKLPTWQLLKEAEKLDLERALLQPRTSPRRGRPPGKKSRWQ